MKHMTMVAVMCVLSALWCGSGMAATIQVSGGGTDVIATTVAGAAAGDVIEITDSLEYIETSVNWVVGVWNITVMATAGQTPTLTYSGSTAEAIIPNVGGFQLGDNDGGTITVRSNCTSTMINGYWMGDGSTLTLENCIFTTSGNTWIPGLWMCLVAEDGENITVNVNNCQFVDHPNTGMGILVRQGATGNLSANFTDCVFNNVGMPINFESGHSTVFNCLFQDWYNFGSNVTFGDGSDVSFSHSAFLMTKDNGYGAGAVGVFVGSSTGGTVTIDHCDFLSTSDPGMGFAVQNVWSGAADVIVTNCNIDVTLTGSVLSNSSDSPSASITYDYCNMDGTADAGCTGGANNTATFVAPNYADIPTDWSYDNAELLTADSEGGSLGSSLGGAVAPPVEDVPVMGALGLGLAAMSLLALGVKKNRR